MKQNTKNAVFLSGFQLLLLQGKASRLLQAHIATVLSHYNLSIPEWKLLGITTEQHALRLAKLAEQLAVEPPLVTVLVDTLVSKRLVRRIPDPLDRRARVISATPEGLQLIREIEQQVNKVLTIVFSGLTPEDLQTYTKILNAIIHNGFHQ